MDLLILVGLICLNGIFAMSEIALVTAKSNRLKKRAEQHASAAIALDLKNNPTLFLSTIQIGITAIGILSGVFGETMLSEPFSIWLIKQGIEADVANIIATVSVVASITYFAIVVGELVPKRFAQNNAEHIAVIVAYPISILARLASPFVWLLSRSTDAILRLGRQSNQIEDSVTEDDIIDIMVEGSESGAIEPQEQQMISNLLHLNDRLVTSLMTPRYDIEYLDITQPIEQILMRIGQTQHSVWPICHGSLDKIIGTISSKVLLEVYDELSIATLARQARRPRYVPESMKGLPLLNHMQQTNCEMAFIVDEYGDIQGLVTHYDLLESIAGELGMAPQHLWAKQQQDGSWIMDAMIPLNELKHRLSIETLDGEKSEGFQTLNGFLTWKTGKVPEYGEVVQQDDWNFEVLSVRHNRVLQVRCYQR